MTLASLKNAISELPDEERRALAAWLIEQDTDGWDSEMANDFARGGRGSALVDRVKSDIARGQFSPITPPAPEPAK